jgi:hypothetical protein
LGTIPSAGDYSMHPQKAVATQQTSKANYYFGKLELPRMLIVM